MADSNAINVYVLYGNLTVETAPITDMSALRKDGVQGVIVKTGDGRVLAAKIESDFYAVCYRGNDSGHWATIVAEDETDFRWSPAEDHLTVRRGRTPLGCLHVWFEGGLVSDAQYVRVQEKFARMIRGEV